MKNFNKHIFLIGFMGTGKSAVSRELAKMIGLKVIDTDALISEATGMSIPEIFEQKGEDGFRVLETQALQEILELESSIISCGGGLPMKEQNQKLMKKAGRSILLTASPENIYMRVKNDDQRPLLKSNMDVEHIRALMEKRKSVYIKTADIIVNTDDKDILQICQEILFRFGQLEDSE